MHLFQETRELETFSFYSIQIIIVLWSYYITINVCNLISYNCNKRHSSYCKYYMIVLSDYS